MPIGARTTIFALAPRLRRIEIAPGSFDVKKLAVTVPLAAFLIASPALAADPPADPDLAQFRAAYTSGDGWPTWL